VNNDPVPRLLPDEGHHRQPGRPRSVDADDAILRATVELLAQSGLGRTTIAAVAARAGVARATIYLRWATRDQLIAAAARHALGRPPFSLSGDLEVDLRVGTRETQQVLGRPGFLAIFPEIIRALLSEDAAVSYDEIAPNRRNLAREYRELAASSGFRTDIAATVPFDLLVGSHINHIMATGRPPTPQVAAQLTEVILAGLRSPAPPMARSKGRASSSAAGRARKAR
jgi:AcrR family transcriptional regulator